MSKKYSNVHLAVYTGTTTFFVLVMTIFIYGYALGEKNLLAILLGPRFFYIPIVVYLLVISFATGSTAYLVAAVTQKRQFSQIEEKLQLLAAGNYKHPLLTFDPAQLTDVHLVNMATDIEKIQQKLISTSKELQQLSSRPQMVDGTTKEKILEEERHRLARELHDSVSQQLFAAMMMMSALNEQSQQVAVLEPYKKQLAMVADIINAAQSEMRALLLHLRPVNLEGKSLKQGIEQLLKELQTKVQIKLKWDVEDINVAATIEDQLFRVVQELLSNTLRHAKANELEVYLQVIGPNLILRVIDDGVGFNQENDEHAGSYGLRNVRERIASVGGTTKIISFKDQGTSVEIKVPIVKGEDDD